MNYADEGTERKLVQAVKEAAARIDYSSTPDPEGVLAECLNKYGFSSKFAKTATDAANKSYTVHYMSTHDDDTRGNDHPLLDYKKVQAKMVQESTPTYKDTVNAPTSEATLTITQVVPKTASEHSTYTPREYKDSYDYVNFLSSGIVKLASSLESLMVETDKYTDKFYSAFNNLRNKSASLDQYTVDALYSHNHKGLNTTMSVLGLTPSAHKTAMLGTSKKASKQIIPNNYTSNAICSIHKIACDLSDISEEIKDIQNSLNDNVESLDMLNAAHTRSVFTKRAANSGNKAKISDNVDATNTAIDAGATLLAGPYMGALGLLTGGVEGLGTVSEQAKNMIESSQDTPSYSSVLDADFIRDDRRIKNMEAWAEVASDPNLAHYPLTDLYSVTKKLLQANPQFEKPTMYPMLVDTVSQVMSQGGRVGLGLHSSTATTMKAINDSLKGLQSGNVGESLKAPISGKVELGPSIQVFDTSLLSAADKIPESLANLYSKTITPAVSTAVKVLEQSAYNNSDVKKLEDLKLENSLAEVTKKLEEREFKESHNGMSEKEWEKDQEKIKAEEQAKVDAENKALADNAFVKEISSNKVEREDYMKDPTAMRRLYAVDSAAFKDKRVRDVVLRIPALSKYPALVNTVATGNVVDAYGHSKHVSPKRLQLWYTSQQDTIRKILSAVEKDKQMQELFAADPAQQLHAALANGYAPMPSK